MGPHNPYIQQFSGLDKFSPQFPDRLSDLLDDRDSISNLSNQHATWLADYLDEILDTLAPASLTYLKCLRVLRWVCGAQRILPTSRILLDTLSITNSYPVASRGTADVYEGFIDNEKVCVNRLRAYSNEDAWAVQKHYREAVTWGNLKHPNIVPFRGATIIPLQLISDWMPGGNITEHIKEHPDANKLGLLSDIADGLNYLHSRNVVHGDLKGPSILVNDTGRARITDFGLSAVISDIEPTASIHEGRAIRWAAPEILGREVDSSKEADIYSFGMVVIEIFSGGAPFADSTPVSVVAMVRTGERPKRPKDPILTNKLWELTLRCLDQDPRRRPEIMEVVRDLQDALVARKGRTDTVGVARVDDTTLREPSFRTRCLILVRRLWRRFKQKKHIPESKPASDRTSRG